MDSVLAGIWPWNAPDPSLPLVLSTAIGQQYLAGFLIGLGVGGVVGASTLGVAMFSLVAPVGSLKAFTAVVPVVNCVANFGTVSVYVKHADWKLVARMWPFIAGGIAIGTYLLPRIAEKHLRKTTSVVYAVVLAQSVLSRLSERRRAAAAAAAAKKDDDAAASVRTARDATIAFYSRIEVTAAVSLACGILTVVTNNSGPIFNIYLLNCGLGMDQFVASRSVIMAGKNLAKVGARTWSGGLTLPVLVHGAQIGALCLVGIQFAKPIKARTSPEFYKYFTWVVLAYTSIKMGMA